METLDETNSLPPSSPESGPIVEEQPTGPKKILKTLAWIGLAIFFLVFFTTLKLPEDRLKTYIQGSIAAELSRQQIGFTAGEGHLSVFLGASYVMKDVTLTFPAPTPPVHLAQIKVAPSLLGMVIGKMGGKLWVQPNEKTDEGSLMVDFSMKKDVMNLSYEANAVDFGKLGILAMAADLKGSLVASGKGELKGDLSIPSSLSGHIGLDISKLNLDAQTIQGFSVPPIRVSEGKIDLDLDAGKASIKTFQLGKSASDDIRAKLTGFATLSRTFMQSTLNIKAEFSLSQSILKAFVLLDALLSPGKQADGSYAFNLTGPVSAVNPVPASAGGK